MKHVLLLALALGSASCSSNSIVEVSPAEFERRFAETGHQHKLYGTEFIGTTKHHAYIEHWHYRALKSGRAVTVYFVDLGKLPDSTRARIANQ